MTDLLKEFIFKLVPRLLRSFEFGDDLLQLGSDLSQFSLDPFGGILSGFEFSNLKCRSVPL